MHELRPGRMMLAACSKLDTCQVCITVLSETPQQRYLQHLNLSECCCSLFSLSHFTKCSCSVDLGSYVAGSWLGMLPGTIAYVYAGNYGRALIDTDGEMGGVKGWQVALGLGITVLAVGYIGKVAKKALDDVENDDASSQST